MSSELAIKRTAVNALALIGVLASILALHEIGFVTRLGQGGLVCETACAPEKIHLNTILTTTLVVAVLLSAFAIFIQWRSGK